MQVTRIHFLRDFKSSHDGDVFSFRIAGWRLSCEYDDVIEQVVFDGYNEGLDLECSGRIDPNIDCAQRIADIALARSGLLK